MPIQERKKCEDMNTVLNTMPALDRRTTDGQMDGIRVIHA